MACKAKQYSDQMVCVDCAQAWDMNDPDPPPCKDTRMEDYVEPFFASVTVLVGWAVLIFTINMLERCGV